MSESDVAIDGRLRDLRTRPPGLLCMFKHHPLSSLLILTTLVACSGEPISLGSGTDQLQATLVDDDGTATAGQCDAEYADCIETGQDPDGCRARAASCLQTAAAAASPTTLGCEADYADCIETGQDPDGCRARLVACEASSGG